MAKQCTRCGLYKANEDFGKHKYTKDHLGIYCAACRREKGQIYNKENRERISAYQRRRRQENPLLKDKYSVSNRARAKAWYRNNRDRALATAKKRREANRESYSQRSASYYQKNKDRIRAYFKGWLEKNKEKVSITNKLYREAHKKEQRELNASWRKLNAVRLKKVQQKWRLEHKDKVNYYSMKRKASKLRAIPKWAIPFFIEEAYDLAQRRTKATGIEWHVDHIVPLQGKTVCGLHVENNLRVIPAIQNHEKNRHYWPNMP